MKQHILYDDLSDLYDIHSQEFEDYLRHDMEDPDDISDDRKYDIANYIAESRLGSKKAILDIAGTFIATGYVGLWDGHWEGCHIFNNLAEIFDYTGVNAHCYRKWYVEGQKLYGRFSHHDGTNYFEYYYIPEQKGSDKFVEQLEEGIAPTPRQMKRYCRSAGRIVGKVYGWYK